MRLNTIDDNYIMIPVSELIRVAFNSTEPRKVKDRAIDIFEKLHKKNPVMCMFGIKRTEELSEIILDEYISLEKYGNSLMYGILNEVDETIIEYLKKFLVDRVCIKLKDLQEISQSLSDFIIKNGDYDYVSNKNLINEEDKEFTLYDYEEDELLTIKLNEKKYIPKLKNKDVK